MRRLTLLLLAAGLTACASHGPLPTAPDRWTYLGNDPDGTQNIYMRVQSSDKKKGTVIAWYKFEFSSPRDVVTGPALKQQTYIERRDLVAVDCAAQTLQLQDESYFDVEGRQVFHVAPTGEAVNANKVYAGGISDTVYEGACGNALQWDSLGSDPQKTQDIYARVQSPQSQQSIVKAVFRFTYHEPRQMVASPSLTNITYSSRQSSVLMDCANQTFATLHETYYDADDVAVFGVTPPKGARPDSVVPDSVSGIMYKSACGIPLDWTYLGTDPRDTQRIYLLGKPEHRSGDEVEARFRFEYLAPGKLATGAESKQVEYVSRTADMAMDCAVYTQTQLRESYQDSAGKEVFSVKPAAPQTALAVPGALSGILQKAACQP